MNNYINRYIEQGIMVFACHKNKIPATTRGFYDCSLNPDILKAQFHDPENMLIGMPTGNLNNIVVIDIDVNKPMEDEHGAKILDDEGNEIIDPRTVEELLDELKTFGDIPDTYQVETPSGGRHLYFQVPFTKINSARRFFNKTLPIDTKANGGYVIAPDGKSDYTVYDDVDDMGIDDIRFRCAALPQWIEDFKKAVVESECEETENILPPEETMEIRSALAFLSSDDRDLWIKIGMALKSTGSPTAKGLFEEWSQKSDKYNAKDQEKRWATFKPSDITIATLFFEAKKKGWITTYSKVDSSNAILAKEPTKILTVFDELEKIKSFTVKTYQIGPIFDVMNRADIKAVRDALYALGGERSSGKTSLATLSSINILIHNSDFCILFFSLDDSEYISAKRVISQLLKKNIMGESYFDTIEFDDVLKRIVITENNVPHKEIITKKGIITISEQLVQICEQVKHRTGTQKIIIIIDYLQLIKPAGDRSSLNDIVKELKISQKILSAKGGCIMFLLSQLNRDRDSGQSRYRETSEIENIADICIDIRCNFIETKNPQSGKLIYIPEIKNPKRFITIEKNKLFPAGQEFTTMINPDFSFTPLIDVNQNAENIIIKSKPEEKDSNNLPPKGMFSRSE